MMEHTEKEGTRIKDNAVNNSNTFNWNPRRSEREKGSPPIVKYDKPVC